ncbi:MAG: DUF2513 domain-containing protein [Idiomarina sp.]|nr:DUF2513 domain-containing protein [Idiomarina sp.]
MKRDMELVRRILFQLEERLEFDEPYVPKVDGYSENEIFYHVKLMSEAGLIEAKNWSDDDGPCWLATSMTAAGHDFLDAARSDRLWAKAKSIVTGSGGALTLEALKIGLSMAVKNAIMGSGS